MKLSALLVLVVASVASAQPVTVSTRDYTVNRTMRETIVIERTVPQRMREVTIAFPVNDCPECRTVAPAPRAPAQYYEPAPSYAPAQYYEAPARYAPPQYTRAPQYAPQPQYAPPQRERQEVRMYQRHLFGLLGTTTTYGNGMTVRRGFFGGVIAADRLGGN